MSSGNVKKNKTVKKERAGQKELGFFDRISGKWHLSRGKGTWKMRKWGSESCSYLTVEGDVERDVEHDVEHLEPFELWEVIWSDFHFKRVILAAIENNRTKTEAEKAGEAAVRVQVRRMTLGLRWYPGGEERKNGHIQDVSEVRIHRFADGVEVGGR